METGDSFRDFKEGWRRIIRVRRFRWRREFEFFCIDLGIRVKKVREVLTPSLEFLFGGCEEVAVAVI